jgi:hypothetical protein
MPSPTVPAAQASSQRVPDAEVDALAVQMDEQCQALQKGVLVSNARSWMEYPAVDKLFLPAANSRTTQLAGIHAQPFLRPQGDMQGS